MNLIKYTKCGQGEREGGVQKSKKFADVICVSSLGCRHSDSALFALHEVSEFKLIPAFALARGFSLPPFFIRGYTLQTRRAPAMLENILQSLFHSIQNKVQELME